MFYPTDRYGIPLTTSMPTKSSTPRSAGFPCFCHARRSIAPARRGSWGGRSPSVFRRVREQVGALARKYARDLHVPADIASEVRRFLRAYQKAQHFQNDIVHSVWGRANLDDAFGYRPVAEDLSGRRAGPAGRYIPTPPSSLPGLPNLSGLPSWRLICASGSTTLRSSDSTPTQPVSTKML
jgi:hypothetical protein